MDIVTKAVNLYFTKGLNPNAVLAAWVLQEQPSESMVKQAIQEVNKRIYLKLYSEKGPAVSFPLADFNKVALVLKKKQSKEPEIPKTKMTPRSPDTLGEQSRIAQFVNYLESLIKPASEPKSSEFTTEHKKLLKEFYGELYKTAQLIYTDLLSVFEEIRNDLVKEASQYYLKGVPMEIITKAVLTGTHNEHLAKQVMKDVMSEVLNLSKSAIDPYFAVESNKIIVGNRPYHLEVASNLAYRARELRKFSNLLNVTNEILKDVLRPAEVMVYLDSMHSPEDLAYSPLAISMEKLAKLLNGFSQYYDFAHLEPYMRRLEKTAFLGALFRGAVGTIGLGARGLGFLGRTGLRIWRSPTFGRKFLRPYIKASAALGGALGGISGYLGGGVSGIVPGAVSTALDWIVGPLKAPYTLYEGWSGLGKARESPEIQALKRYE